MICSSLNRLRFINPSPCWNGLDLKADTFAGNRSELRTDTARMASPEPPPLQRADLSDDPAEGLLQLIKHYGVLHHRRAVSELQRLYDRPGDMPVLGEMGKTGMRLNPDMLHRFGKLNVRQVQWNRQTRTWRR